MIAARVKVKDQVIWENVEDYIIKEEDFKMHRYNCAEQRQKLAQAVHQNLHWVSDLCQLEIDLVAEELWKGGNVKLLLAQDRDNSIQKAQMCWCFYTPKLFVTVAGNPSPWLESVFLHSQPVTSWAEEIYYSFFTGWETNWINWFI